MVKNTRSNGKSSIEDNSSATASMDSIASVGGAEGTSSDAVGPNIVTDLSISVSLLKPCSL